MLFGMKLWEMKEDLSGFGAFPEIERFLLTINNEFLQPKQFI